MKKIAFIDLDRTLFDVDKMKEEIGKRFKIEPNTKNILELFYQKDNEFFTFMEENINSYLFPESKNFLEELKEKGVENILLTKGVEEFQRWKIELLTEINSFFDKEIYVEGDKWPEVEKIVRENSGSKFYSFNDDLKQNENFRDFIEKDLGVDIKIFNVNNEFSVREAFKEINFNNGLIEQTFKFK